jgi:hypothetical protein
VPAAVRRHTASVVVSRRRLSSSRTTRARERRGDEDAEETDRVVASDRVVARGDGDGEAR